MRINLDLIDIFTWHGKHINQSTQNTAHKWIDINQIKCVTFEMRKSHRIIVIDSDIQALLRFIFFFCISTIRSQVLHICASQQCKRARAWNLLHQWRLYCTRICVCRCVHIVCGKNDRPFAAFSKRHNMCICVRILCECSLITFNLHIALESYNKKGANGLHYPRCVLNELFLCCLRARAYGRQ